MKRIQQLALALLIMAAFSSVTLAGDYAILKVIGFSENGKYLAFEEFGAWDGSGGDYATTYYVDTAKNSFAIAPTIFERTDFPDDKLKGFRIESLYKKDVAAKLKKFGIQRGNTGQLVVAHLLNDLSFVKPIQREHYFYEDGKNDPVNKLVTDYEGGFIRRDTTEIEKVIFNASLEPYTQNTEEFYELTLIPTLAKSIEGCSEGYKFELTIKDNTGHRNHELKTLQKDGDILPERRNCPFGYKIEQVYIYQGKIAVFLNVFGQGFEGPDMRYMVVTGEI
jgi:predicted secreted protein